MDPLLAQQVQHLTLRVRPCPTGVDHHPLPGADLRPDNFQQLFFFGQNAAEIANAFGGYNNRAVYGMDNIRLVIGLIRIDCQQVHVSG